MSDSPQNILITGASTGIGSSLALIYSRPQVNLFLCARNKQNLDEVAQLCRRAGANVVVKTFDVRDEKSAAEFVAEIEEKYAIDLVIANAGIRGEDNFSKEDLTKIHQILDINIKGVINIISPVIERMKQRKKGQIAIVSSLAGFCGIPTSPAYSASKAAIRVYAESLLINLVSHNIKVSAVCPGYVRTTMTAQNKFWMPFLMSSQRAAEIIKNGLEKNKSRIAFPLPLYFLAWLATNTPRVLIDFILRLNSVRNSNKI